MRKKSKQLERHLKGLSNHWRIEILDLIKRMPGVTLEELSNTLKGNSKTISEHTRKLVVAGLVNKKYEGRVVRHHLSPYGERFHSFLSKFE